MRVANTSSNTSTPTPTPCIPTPPSPTTATPALLHCSEWRWVTHTHTLASLAHRELRVRGRGVVHDVLQAVVDVGILCRWPSYPHMGTHAHGQHPLRCV